MKKQFLLLFAIALVFCLFACASSNVSTWKADDTENLNGKTEAQIIAKFGEPDRKFKNQGKQVFEYRKPAEKDSGKNTYAAIFSFGFMSGKDSTYLDILRITFNKGKVVDASYEESVVGLALPGGMGGR